MTKRMLIDATHAEETRVVVLDGNRLEDFDVETSTKRQIKGNIYLAKVVRVEPSLQAAFVEYGGGRHGFLAFDEIHPDYYQIPVADRQRLLAMEAEEARREQEEEDRAAEQGMASPRAAEAAPPIEIVALPAGIEEPAADTVAGPAAVAEAAPHVPGAAAPPAPPPPSTEPEVAVGEVATAPLPPDAATPHAAADVASEPTADVAAEAQAPAAEAAPAAKAADLPAGAADVVAEAGEDETTRPAQPLAIRRDRREGEPLAETSDTATAEAGPGDGEAGETEQLPEEPPPETLGGEHDTTDEPRPRRLPSRLLRSYKIQEVIHRRQILLVQVEKEERGTKGAALTTYISLAGRYCVLMPNSPRGGGISRKITAPADRRRLKEVMTELDLPDGMGLIVRTAGANRPKPEIKRDAEYLLRLWDDIREQTLKSVAPALIYEEASLIKRAIRDVYSRDIDEITVDGEDAWRAARDFMRMLMPSHAKKVQLWHDPSAPSGTAGQPLFARHQVDAQLDGMLSPNVQLRSGGYLVINQAEALVAIDVNSGRSTRERGIEETALRTNLEAAEEVARQLRLRDLAGLIVIDFIDMESRRNNGLVEKRLKEALKADRARIQLGHISHFGLLEMSRQRLRPSLAETSLVVCAHCGGTGHVRSTESSAIHVLRAIEEEGAKRRSGEILVHAAMPIVLYILNHKRDRLGEIEARHGLRVAFAGDDQLIPPQIRIEKLRAYAPVEPAAVLTPETGRGLPAPSPAEEAAEEPDEIEAAEAPEGAAPAAAEAQPRAVAADKEAAEEDERRRRRRRRRRRGGRREEGRAEGAVAEGAVEGVPEAWMEGALEGEAAEEMPLAAVTAEPAVTETGLPAAAPEAAVPHIEGVPEHAEPAVAEDAEARARRRGRRGGRRRRREEEVLPSVAAPGAEQPELPPAYAGPTPANPFGGQMFDIFDVLEQAEARSAAAPLTTAPAPRVAAPEAPTAPPPVAAWAEPAEAPHVEAPLAEALHAEAPAAPPEGEAAAEVAAPPAPEPEPAIKPIMIGAEAVPPADKKRGWWRRPA